MELTSLPTDSLYKFLAFFGLSILLIIPAYIYKQYIDVKEKMFNAETENDILERRITSLEGFSDLIHKYLEMHITRLETVKDVLKEKDNFLLEFDKYSINTQNAILDKRLLLQDKTLETRIMHSKQGNNLKLTGFLIDQLAVFRRAAVVAVILGLIMACVGFYKWYIIQGYIDKGIMKEISK